MLKRLFLPLALLATSALAAPVTGIDLSNAITAYSRTSSSTTLPMTWQVTFASNVHEGYFLHIYIYSDSAKTTLVQEARHYLTHADLQSGANISFADDGLTAIGATDWEELRVEKTSPNGLGYQFIYPNALSPTDAVVTMTWSTTDKDASVALSGGNLIATWNGAGGNYAGVRTNRCITSGKAYWETTVNNVSARTRVGIASTTASISTSWSPSQDGGSTTNQAAVRYAGAYEYDTSSVAAAPTLANNDTVDTELDYSAKKVWWRVNNGSWLPTGDPAIGTGGLSVSAMSSSICPAAQLSFGGQVTATFSSFARTPSSGFSAP